MSGTPASEYHDRTKHTPTSVRETDFRLDFENKPRPDKVYENLPQVPLATAIHPPAVPALAAIAQPRADPMPAPGRPGQRRPDLEMATQLCYLSAGITKRIELQDRTKLFRAGACTGALYHVDLYLVAGDLEGLSAGVYHFDPRTLSLDVLREGDHRGVLADATGHDGVADAPLSVVTTSTWWRNAWKYRARTFRHAFWDSGTILANLLAVAHALDLPAEIVLGFADEPVAELIGVDHERETPLEIVPVGCGDPTPSAPAVDPIDPETRPLSREEIEYPLIHDAWRAGVLSDGDAAVEWRNRSRAVEPRSGDGERIELDPVDHEIASDRPLAQTIRRRGSCRTYAREDLSFRKVSTVLDRATRGVPMDCLSGAAGSESESESVSESESKPESMSKSVPQLALALNDAYLIVNGVEGLASGSYQYHPAAGEFERLQSGDFRQEAGHLALDQRLAADAALCLYFLTDLEAVVDGLGDRGYRAVQLEAATTAGRLYLAAYAHRDLGATGLTFYDDVVTEFFEPRATGQTPTFLWTLGRPA